MVSSKQNKQGKKRWKQALKNIVVWILCPVFFIPLNYIGDSALASNGNEEVCETIDLTQEYVQDSSEALTVNEEDKDEELDESEQQSYLKNYDEIGQTGIIAASEEITDYSTYSEVHINLSDTSLSTNANYTVVDNLITLLSKEITYFIYGSTSRYRIMVGSEVEEMVLHNCYISPEVTGGSTIEFHTDAEVKVLLSGYAHINVNFSDSAALKMGKETKLTIDSVSNITPGDLVIDIRGTRSVGIGTIGDFEGELIINEAEININNANASSAVTAIGAGGYGDLAGSIIINSGSGHIQANNTGSNGNGIGVNYSGNLTGMIEITGRKVTARGTAGGAIGGGTLIGGTINIKNSQLALTSSANGATLGSAATSSMTYSSIHISDSQVQIINSGNGARIGTGGSGHMSGSKIIIEGNSTIEHTSILGSAAFIGTGLYGDIDGESQIIIRGQTYLDASMFGGIGSGPGGVMAGLIDIGEDAEVIMTANQSAAIGGGGVYINSIGGFTGEIKINDNAAVTVVSAGGSTPAAAIGSGGGNIDKLVLFSGTIHINTTGKISAIANAGAGIGSGGYSDFTNTAQIIIDSGTIEAKSSQAAGIGCGQYSSLGGTILIKDGFISAIGGSHGPGIGTVFGAVKSGGGSVTLDMKTRINNQEPEGEIRIMGGKIHSIGGSEGGAGIGTGASYLTADDAVLKRSLGIYISGGEIEASGGRSNTGDILGAGIGTGYIRGVDNSLVKDIEIEIAGGKITALGGGSEIDDEIKNASGIGYGIVAAKGDGNVYVSLSTAADIEAYAWRAAVTADEIYGDGQYVNAYFSNDSEGYMDIDIYTNGNLDSTSWYGKLELPAGYQAFAYTLLNRENHTDTWLVTSIDGENKLIRNGDETDHSIKAGPHQVSYGDERVTSMNATTVLWPVTFINDADIATSISIYYYYFIDEFTTQEFNELVDGWSGQNPIIAEDVIVGDDFEINTGILDQTMYTAWYYTIGSDDTKNYFSSIGNIAVVEENMEIHVYAVSTLIDIEVSVNDFFWYANKDTEISQDAGIFEVKSASYTITNHSLTGLSVSLSNYTTVGDSRIEIEERLLNGKQDTLIVNLTDDLGEDSLGQDLLRTQVGSSPYGTYSAKLGSGKQWQYSFGGYYYPTTGRLPEQSATSDYKLLLCFEMVMTEP